MECADRLDMLDILSKEALEGRRGDDLLVFLRESGGDRLLQEHIISTRDPVRRSVLTAAFLGAVALEEDFNLRVQEDLFKFTIRYFIAHGGELLLPLARFPLVDQSSYFIDSIAAPPASCAGEYTVRDFPRLAACWKLIHPSARAGGFNNYFTARAVMLSNNSLWVRWFAALVSPSPDISELAKQVLLFYRPTAFALWTPYVWNGARVEALQRAMPELFDCATPASSLFIRTLINTYGEKYIAGGCTVPLDATERLSLYFKGDARDAATVLQHLSWCTGRPEVMLLEARYPRIRAFFTCRKRLQFIAIVVSAAKKSRHSEHDLTKAEDSEETQITALLSDPRVCNRAGGGSRLTSPLAAGIARFI